MTTDPDPASAAVPEGPPLTLDQFLKREGAVSTGGQAKFVIQEGEVTVNGEVDTRRGRKLKPGDVITFRNQSWTVPS